MKKYLTLLFLVLSTPLFAQVNPEVTSTKNLYILEGSIDNKHPITMYLTIEEDLENGTQIVAGEYYYNTMENTGNPLIVDRILLKESVLDENSNLTLKGFTNKNDLNWDYNSTGQFTGTVTKEMVFTGTWSDEENSFDFEVKPNPNTIIQEMEIKRYEFKDTNSNSNSFSYSAEILQIMNPQNLASIEKINNELLTAIDDLNTKYSEWKKDLDAAENRSYHNNTEFVYSDNNIISLVFPEGWNQVHLEYSLDSGEIKVPQAEVTSTKNIHILEGSIDNKYPITMYLIIEESTKKASGRYYYNTIGDFIYFGESVLDENSKLSLKEFANEYPDFYNGENSTGEFSGTLSDTLVFNGTWGDGENSFDFEVKPNPNAIVQEIEIKEYTYLEYFNFNLENPSFEVEYEIFQIANPKKLSSIEKINEALKLESERADYFIDENYSRWRQFVYQQPYATGRSWIYIGSNELLYIDNNIISFFPESGYNTGGSGHFPSQIYKIYSLDTGEVLNLKATDLVYSAHDEKLRSLIRQKLIDEQQGKYYSIPDYTLESIGLRDNYTITASGIAFKYYLQDIAFPAKGFIDIHFTFEELKPFVNRDSELWYLFE